MRKSFDPPEFHEDPIGCILMTILMMPIVLVVLLVVGLVFGVDWIRLKYKQRKSDVREGE